MMKIYYCPNCKIYIPFTYKGMQDGFGVIPPFKLYNCGICFSTFGENTLSELEKIANESTRINKAKI